MKRSIDQNSLFHCWCRDIAAHLAAAGIKNVSETTVKGLILATLGNQVELLGTNKPMPSSKYRRADADLTPDDLKRGFISMEELLAKMQIWANIDLNLMLETPNDGT